MVGASSPGLTRFPRQRFVIGEDLDALLASIERAGAPTRVIALEPDPQRARDMLGRSEWAGWIEQGRLRVLAGPAYAGSAVCARHVDVSERPVVLTSPALLAARGAEAAAAQAVAARIISEAEANAEARRRFAGRYLLQSLGNLPVIAREADAAALDGRFAGHPAVVVGAGPSLDRNLPALKALQDRAVIIGADTTLRPLLAGGVRPHVMAAVDPAEQNARHLAGVPALDDIFLAAEGSLHPSAFTGFGGRTFVFKVSDHEPWPWLRTAGLDRGLLRAWGSVITSAFDLARRMGCTPIVFAGLDLSYPVRQPYCANTIYDDTWREAIATYGCTWESIVDDYFNRVPDFWQPDASGTPVRTSPTLLAFRDWLREEIAGDASRVFVNATGAGILHGSGIAQASLDDVLHDRPAIGAEVRTRLREAHAASRGNSGRLRANAAGLAAHFTRPRSARLVGRWIDFAAGGVTASEIRTQLESVLPALGACQPR